MSKEEVRMKATERVEKVGTDVIIHCNNERNAGKCLASIRKVFNNPMMKKTLGK